MYRNILKKSRILPAILNVVGVLFTFSLMGFLTIGNKWEAPPSSNSLKNPIAVNEQSIADAKAIYTAKCANCHGKKGKGDGPKSEELDVEVGDLTSAGCVKQSDGALFWKTSEGKKPMPSFKTELTAEERWKVVIYIRELEKSKK